MPSGLPSLGTVISDINSNLVTTIADGFARRIQVEAKLTGGVGNASASSLVDTQLLYSGSADMRVAGTAASPKAFTYTPPTGKTAVINSIGLVLVAGTITFNGTGFLNGSAMTNGLAINITVNNTTYTIANLKINEDFLLYTMQDVYGAGSAGGLLGGGTNDILTCSFDINQPLSQAAGDNVSVLARDALNSTGNNLLYMRGVVQGYIQ